MAVKRSRQGDTASHKKPRSQNTQEQESDSDLAQIEDMSSDQESIVLDTDSEEEEEFKDETAADTRRRLAKQYLENLQKEAQTQVAEHDFDAADLDREYIESRLRQDVAQHKGRIFRFFKDKLAGKTDNDKHVSMRFCNMADYAVTSVAVHYPHVYTVTKNRVLSQWRIEKNKQVHQVKSFRSRKDTKKDKQGGSQKELSLVHTGEITSVAVSPDGKHVVTGGKDHRIIVWTTKTLSPVRMFDTRDKRGVVTGLAFRLNTNELYASCADLKVRTYNIEQLAQVETLFGHQDAVADIAALGQERCVTVGSRDRSAVVWKIAEQTRLTFNASASLHQGSVDCCAQLDDQYFVTGAENGALCLWSMQKKRPVHVVTDAHGSGRPVTALCAVPYSDLVVSGSTDGVLNLWVLDSYKLVALGSVAVQAGIVNRIAVSNEDVSDESQIHLAVAISREPRMGRWLKLKGSRGSNGFGVVAITV